MDRRKLIASTACFTISLSGCIFQSNNSRALYSEIGIQERLCETRDTQAKVEHSAGEETTIVGIFENIEDDKTLTASLYGPSEEDRIICDIETDNLVDEEIHCSGSVRYNLDIVHKDIELTGVTVLHSNEEGSEEIAEIDL